MIICYLMISMVTTVLDLETVMALCQLSVNKLFLVLLAVVHNLMKLLLYTEFFISWSCLEVEGESEK